MGKRVTTRWGESVDLSYEHKTACPQCRNKYDRDKSGDNLHVYGLDSDGKHLGCYCFSCGYTIPSEEWIEENREEYPEEFEYMGTEWNEEVHDKLKENTGVDSKGYRGIREDISRSLGVRYEYSVEDGSVTKVFYPNTKECLTKPLKESLTGYKVREHPKKFTKPIGYVGKDSDLFMQWKFKTHKGILLIVAGEHDSMAAYQMLLDMHNRSNGKGKYDEVAVVSGTSGEGAIAYQVSKQYEWVSQFQKVIICMDEDKAGRKAAEDIVKVLPKGKAFVMRMRYNDPNEYILKNDEQSFINDFWGHKAYTPEGIYASTDLYKEALESVESEGISLPDWFKGLTKFTHGFGIPENEIFVVVSQTSGGKTVFVNNLTIHWVLNEPNHTVGVLSLEATAGRYTRNLLSSYLGIPLNRMTADERRDLLLREDIKDKAERLFSKEDGTPRFYVMDDRGADTEVVKNKLEMMVKKLGCTILLLDPYSDLLSSMSVQEQEDLATWIKKLQKETGVTPVLVSHINKGGMNEDGEVSEDGMMGSSFLAKASGTTVALERDKQAENEIVRNTTRVRVLKNREHSETGVCGYVFFNREDHKLYDLDDYKEKNPHMFYSEST